MFENYFMRLLHPRNNASIEASQTCPKIAQKNIRKLSNVKQIVHRTRLSINKVLRLLCGM